MYCFAICNRKRIDKRKNIQSYNKNTLDRRPTILHAAGRPDFIQQQERSRDYLDWGGDNSQITQVKTKKTRSSQSDLEFLIGGGTKLS